MANSSEQTHTEIGPLYPIYEALRNAAQPVHPSSSARRLLWNLNGPLERAISVLPSETPTHGVNMPSEPLYDSATETRHPIAQEPVSTPKVSSVTVGVYQLEEWGSTWCDMHEGHADPPELEDGEWDGTDGWNIVKQDGELKDGEVTAWRVVKVADPAMARFVGGGAEFKIVEFEDGETDVELLGCCGEEPPGGEDYHTELLAAKAVMLWEWEPLPDDTELMVELTWFERLGIGTAVAPESAFQAHQDAIEAREQWEQEDLVREADRPSLNGWVADAEEWRTILSRCLHSRSAGRKRSFKTNARASAPRRSGPGG
ncbi:uncharacterized protein MYCGRDRAFT_91538 [Zymoseptoria tritici IPO323]|uniref:Uncharacterized protein n=1 Tax=Zymoseptoria tritici (strain CBS 115943 / IPO323) TaxID=336722 RepID=F9X651_ZYMTI|nr:uncharacterized protein MYCGRDRAFT_91538 [Zymoseptoria tritici IPO323]EGP89500.1 hypothetical protein MYCGRDRAFT_91538 [Zymoseptoria tritici IPO323]